MDKLKRTFSFRGGKKKKSCATESTKPLDWVEDERRVREGDCYFHVKYLGRTEVSESRGMPVCEEAMRKLRIDAKKSERFSFRKTTKKTCPTIALLYVSGDSIRVVENKLAYEKIPAFNRDDTHGLIVDQTIEKVSFCAPDRNHERGFAYICRDGTTRQWMCHAFIALNDSGERLSHAVGCAFAICLEKKQQREKESVEVVYNPDKTSFTRNGSFRQTSLTERMQDPQSVKIAEPVASSPKLPHMETSSPVTTPVNRPRANQTFNRQGSFTGHPKLNSGPFKRNGSLRLDELPSNLQRQSQEFSTPKHEPVAVDDAGKLNSDVHADISFDPIAEMCQQLTMGLSSMAFNPTQSSDANQALLADDVKPIQQTNPWAAQDSEETLYLTTKPSHNTWESRMPSNSITSSSPTLQKQATDQFNAPINFSSTNPFLSHINKPVNTNPFLDNNAASFRTVTSNYNQEFIVNL